MQTTHDPPTGEGDSWGKMAPSWIERAQYDSDRQCQRKPECGPKLQQSALNFLATFSVVTLLNNDLSFSRHCPRSSSVRAINVALSSLTLPLRQRMQPFTTNKALSWPPLHRDRAIRSPCLPPRSGGSWVIC